MLEALVCHPLGQCSFGARFGIGQTVDERFRYHQGPDAAVKTETSPWSTASTLASLAIVDPIADATPRFLDDRERDRQAGDASRSIQRSGCRSHRHSAKNGHPFHILRMVQANARG